MVFPSVVFLVYKLTVLMNGFQVTWDEPDILQNVKRVNPWLVELVSSMPTIHLAHLSPPRKRPRFSQHPDYPFAAQFQSSVVPRNHLFPRDSLFSCFSDSPPAGIQGARHTQFGVSLPNLQLNKMQTDLFHPGIHQLDQATPSSKISAGVSVGNPIIQDNISCFGHPSESLTKSFDAKSPQLILFGQPILTEQQVFFSKLENKICHGATVNNSSEGNLKKQVNKFDGLVSAVIQKTSLVAFPFHDDHRTLELEIGTGHCKVFMESDDVGRTLNLSDFGSYEELYRKLADMFGIKESRMMSHVLYKDAAGAIKHTGDEPFRFGSPITVLKPFCSYLHEFLLILFLILQLKLQAHFLITPIFFPSN